MDRSLTGVKECSRPIVDLTVDGKALGDVVELRAPGNVKVRASARSAYPMIRVEVLANGKVVASAALGKETRSAEIDTTLRVEQSGWLALRVVGPPQADVDGEQLYAHTSPVYVTVTGKPGVSKEDARFFLAWIDRLREIVQERDRIPGPRAKAEVEAEVEQARAVYQKIIARIDQ